jgi:hypothetical protein
LEGTLEVPDEEKLWRTIAIGRTRKIGFTFPKREPISEEDEDSNDVTEDVEEVGEPNEEAGKNPEEDEEDK